MSLINHDLVADIDRFHAAGESEVALLIVDEWRVYEDYNRRRTSEKRLAEIALVRKAVVKDMLIILFGEPKDTVEWLQPKLLGQRHKVMQKMSAGALHKTELLKTLEKNKVSAVVLIGGTTWLCIHETLVGGEMLSAETGKIHSYPGLLSYGFTVMTAAPLLSPFVKYASDMETFPTMEKPWNTTLQNYAIPRCSFDERAEILRQQNEISSTGVEFLPFTLLEPGFRYYRSVFDIEDENYDE